MNLQHGQRRRDAALRRLARVQARKDAIERVTMAAHLKYFTVEDLKAARKQQQREANRRYEEKRQASGAVNRGLDRRINTRRAEGPRLPFYPPVKQIIYTYPPIVPGVWALSFPISTRPVVVQA